VPRGALVERFVELAGRRLTDPRRLAGTLLRLDEEGKLPALA